jgi:hypothetical protein
VALLKLYDILTPRRQNATISGEQRVVVAAESRTTPTRLPHAEGCRRLDLVCLEFEVRGFELFYARDASARGTAVQPRAEAFYRILSSVRNDFDGPVGQIARMTSNGEPLSFESRAMAKIHTLHTARDQKIASYSFHAWLLRGPLVRLSHRHRTPRRSGARRGDARGDDNSPIGMLCTGKSRSGMALGFHRRIPGARVLARLEMLLSARDGSLRRVILRGGSFSRTRHPGRRDGLPRIAHFLHRGATAAG